MKLLFFGDIVGRIGREALIKVLPEIKKEHEPDVVIANVENIAHGRGATNSTLQPVLDAGVDIATMGDHVWDKPETQLMLQDEKIPLVRPANFPPGAVGQGARIFEVGAYRLLVINLLGRVFLNEGLDDPFRAFDRMLEEFRSKKPHVVLVDFHAEATSEKQALGWYVDGRASVMVGTHTHVSTADGRILPGGTAYLTDVGMCGALNSVIGCAKEDSLKRFLTAAPWSLEIPTEGPAVVSGALIEVDAKTGKGVSIKSVQEVVD